MMLYIKFYLLTTLNLNFIYYPLLSIKHSVVLIHLGIKSLTCDIIQITFLHLISKDIIKNFKCLSVIQI